MKTLALLLMAAPALLIAQEDLTPRPRPLRPLGTVFLRTDSVELGLRTRFAWRGFELGSWPFAAGVHMGLWQIDGISDKHAIRGHALATVPLVNRDRTSRRDLTELYAGYRYRIDSEQGEANLGYADRRFAFSGGTTHRPSIDAAIQHRVGIPITELRPILGVTVSRETGQAPTTWVEAKFVLEAGLPPKDNNAASYGGRVELRPAFSNLSRIGESTRSMGFHGGVLSLWLSGDRSSTSVGPLMMELGGELWWTRVPTGTTYGLFAVRLVIR